jgi:hypothetical protein
MSITMMNKKIDEKMKKRKNRKNKKKNKKRKKVKNKNAPRFFFAFIKIL